MSSTPRIQSNAGITETQEEQRDHTFAATATTTIFGTPELLLELHSGHGVHEDENEGSSSLSDADRPHSAGVGGPTTKPLRTTGRYSPIRSRAEDAWNWLLKMEENYRETMANVTMEVPNHIYMEDTTSEDEDYDDEKHRKYHYSSPEPEEPTLARRASSEAWFPVYYTDYRKSSSASESEDDVDDDRRYEVDSEGETEDETASPSLTCKACRRDVCECTTSLLKNLATASLWDDEGARSGDMHSSLF